VGYAGRVLKIIRQILALLWKAFVILARRWLGYILKRVALFVFVLGAFVFLLVFLLSSC
jgi:hypothetical protein